MSQNKPIAVVILAAGSIKNKYQSYSFVYNSPALVPIASRSTLSFILAFYEDLSVNIYIAINENEEDLFKKELLYYNNITLVTIKDSLGVCDTLKQVLFFVKEDDIVINVGTTIPTVLAKPHSAIIDINLSTHEGYSGIKYFDQKLIFTPKSKKVTEDFYAFTGVLRETKSELSEALIKVGTQTDLLELVILLNKKTPMNFLASEWIDTGHEINYADARKKLISSRSFNAITVNNHTGILTKKSKNIEKLGQEVNYVGMLPTELKILYPRILSSDNTAGLVQMEYYGYPNLSELQLYRAIDSLQWTRIFDGLLFSLQTMKRHSFSIGPEAFKVFYLQKTLVRTEQYLSTLSNQDVFRSFTTININGEECYNLDALKDRIAVRIENLYDEGHFCVMHGDFCFNNILFDSVSDTVKLIDPRGSFGEACVGIYGDQKYDLAKLLHSTVGNYDYIVNNLFAIEQKDNCIDYSFPLRENQTILEQLSFDILKKLNYEKNDILFIVGLLFLSMCPLHADNHQRQRLMYVHGLAFVNKYL